MATNRKHPLAGLCYVLTEAFYHLDGKKHGLRPMRYRYYGLCHWWLETESGLVIDFTADQFTRPYPYHRGRCGGFLTKKPSKRAQAIMELVSSSAIRTGKNKAQAPRS